MRPSCRGQPREDVGSKDAPRSRGTSTMGSPTRPSRLANRTLGRGSPATLVLKRLAFAVCGALAVSQARSETFPSPALGQPRHVLAGVACGSLSSAQALHRAIDEAARSPTPRHITTLDEGCRSFRGEYTPVRLEPSLPPINGWTIAIDERGPSTCDVGFDDSTIQTRCRSVRRLLNFVVVRLLSGREVYVLEGSPSLPDQYVARQPRSQR